MTFVILTGQIDISVGSQFAVCSIVCGMLAKPGVPMPVVVMVMLAIGGLLGSLNGYLVGHLRLPSIVVTLAMLAVQPLDKEVAPEHAVVPQHATGRTVLPLALPC